MASLLNCLRGTGYLPLTEDTRFNDLGKQRKIAQTTNNGLMSPRIAESRISITMFLA